MQNNQPVLLNKTNENSFASWVTNMPEAEILRILRVTSKYYFAGGKPGVIPVKVFHEILDNIVQEEKNQISKGNKEYLNNYNYGQTAGNPKLKEILAKRLQNRDGLKNIDPADVIITNGSQQMIYTLCDSLINSNSIILSARPTYLGFLQAVEKMGGNIVTLPSDDNGIIPEFIPSAIHQCETELNKKTNMLYVVPYSDNPKGTTMPANRKDMLMDYAYEHDFFIVEDAAYKEIQFESLKIDPIKQRDPENEKVAYVSSSTKEAAAFRIGYSVLPSPLLKAAIKAKSCYDACSSELLQAILAQYYDKYIDKALPQVRLTYKNRRDALVKAIDEHLKGYRTNNSGGFFVWFESEDANFDSFSFLEHAIKDNVAYVPGKPFYPSKGFEFHDNGSLAPSKAKNNAFRLGYSVLEPEDIKIGIQRLAQLIDEHQQERS